MGLCRLHPPRPPAPVCGGPGPSGFLGLGCSPRGPAWEREPVCRVLRCRGPGSCPVLGLPHFFPSGPYGRQFPASVPATRPQLGPRLALFMRVVPELYSASPGLEPLLPPPTPSPLEFGARTRVLTAGALEWLTPGCRATQGCGGQIGVESPSVSWERGLGPCSGGVRPLSVGAAGAAVFAGRGRREPTADWCVCSCQL